MSMDHVLKGSKISFCETVVFCHSGHDENSVWQVRHFGLIFRGRRNMAQYLLYRPRQKSC